MAGASVPVPVYDYAIHDRIEEVRVVTPASIVVVEGILVLWEPTLRERFDLKVFIDTARRPAVDPAAPRATSPSAGALAESIIEQYLTTVRPSHEQFIEPSKRYADVIIPEGGLNRPAIDVLLARIRELAFSPERAELNTYRRAERRGLTGAGEHDSRSRGSRRRRARRRRGRSSTTTR